MGQVTASIVSQPIYNSWNTTDNWSAIYLKRIGNISSYPFPASISALKVSQAQGILDHAY